MTDQWITKELVNCPVGHAKLYMYTNGLTINVESRSIPADISPTYLRNTAAPRIGRGPL